jgi:hypothetical protein
VFAEDLDAFLDVAAGFAISATLAGVSVSILLDAPGVDAFDGEVSTTEPSALIKAGDDPDVGESLVIASAALPANLVHLAGTYTVRRVMPEPPDGAFVRAFLGK